MSRLTVRFTIPVVFGCEIQINDGLQVYSSRLATVSAIKGACPAGGCCLSLCCDLRVMTDFGHIGLNEVQTGFSMTVIASFRWLTKLTVCGLQPCHTSASIALLTYSSG